MTPPASRQGRGPSVGTPSDRSTPSASKPASRDAHLVAVENQRAEAGDDEQLQEDVEQRDAGLHDREPVEGEQQAGDAAENVGPEHPAGDADQQQHADDPGQRRGETPADLVVAEDRRRPGDQPLAQRRVHDEHVAAVVLVPVAQQLLRLGRVVDLVEHLALGPVESPQPGQRRLCR